MDRRPGSEDLEAERHQDRIDADQERWAEEEPPARLSTCGRCGGTIERRPGAVAGWGHLAETERNADGHLPDPDDSYRAGPGEEE